MLWCRCVDDKLHHNLVRQYWSLAGGGQHNLPCMRRKECPAVCLGTMEGMGLVGALLHIRAVPIVFNLCDIPRGDNAGEALLRMQRDFINWKQVEQLEARRFLCRLGVHTPSWRWIRYEAGWVGWVGAES